MTVKPVMELVTLCTVMLFMDESTFDACKTLLILQVYRLHSMSLMAVKPVMAVVRVCTATYGYAFDACTFDACKTSPPFLPQYQAHRLVS